MPAMRSSALVHAIARPVRRASASIMMAATAVSVAARALLLLGAALPSASVAAKFTTIDGDRFVDSRGRQVIFHGLNVVRKNDTWGSYAWLDEKGYAAMHAWGVNCIRLGFTWAAIEPEPGVYSEECLKFLERHIAWAERHGINVLLDLHHDLYAMRFSDGAPDWAVLTDGLPHVADGQSWSDAYVTSPAVQRAMDNFYANKPGPDGVGLQEHYARAWRKVAERFAQNANVIGYDLMNEPFAGSVVPQGMGVTMQAMAEEMNRSRRDGAPLDAAGVAALWATPAGRAEILGRVADPAVYARVIDTAQPIYQQFERERLQPLFQRVADTIREVDREHLIFFEPNGAANMGVFTALDPLKLASGARDPHQAYAPHGYDLVTDTSAVASASDARVALIFARHAATAQRLRLPMLVGEWGAYYGNADARPAAEFISREFEKLRCGDLYWALEPDLAQQKVFPALCRPYPMEIAGELLGYRARPETGEFECRWRETRAGETTRIFVPKAYWDGAEPPALTPAGSEFRVEPAGDGNNFLLVPAAGAGERALTIRRTTEAAHSAGAMVLVPGAERTVGTSADERRVLAQRFNCDLTWLNDDLDRRTVRLAPFWIDRFPVSNAQYRTFVAATGARAPWLGGRFPAEAADQPVVGVTQQDAMAYAAWAGKRLPTAEEWEVAARADADGIFPWGDAWPGPVRFRDAARIPDWARPETQPLGSGRHGRSAAGMEDFVQQVCEWTSTTMPHHGATFVQVKGTSWLHEDPVNFRSAAGAWTMGSFTTSWVGFRCALDGAKPPPPAPRPAAGAPVENFSPSVAAAATPGARVEFFRLGDAPSDLRTRFLHWHGLFLNGGDATLSARSRGFVFRAPATGPWPVGLFVAEAMYWNDAAMLGGPWEENPILEKLASGPGRAAAAYRLFFKELDATYEFRAGEDYVDLLTTVANKTDRPGKFDTSSCFSLTSNPLFYDGEMTRTFILTRNRGFVPLRQIPRPGDCVRWIEPSDTAQFGGCGDPGTMATVSRDGKWVFAVVRLERDAAFRIQGNAWLNCLHTDAASVIKARSAQTTRQRVYFLKGDLAALQARLLRDIGTP